jgi:dihydropteroate synthase
VSREPRNGSKYLGSLEERWPRPAVMGVVNVTPDSFSDGGRFGSAEDAIAHARLLADEGAAIVDVGGESTRPGAAPVTVDEELRRVVPVLEGLAGIPVSIDNDKG